MNTLTRLLSIAAITVTALSSLNASEAKVAHILAPWQAEGMLFMIEEKKARFFGAVEGTMYVQTGDKTHMDELAFVCPSTQIIDLSDETVVTEGNCIIGVEEDVIFAAFSCAGPTDGCEGRFDLKGGTGKFKGISGGSLMSSRTAMKGLEITPGTMTAQKQASGLMVLPELTYKTPAK